MLFLHAWYIERFVREQRETLLGYRFHDAFSISKNELYLQWLSPDQRLVNWRLLWDAGHFFIGFPDELTVQARKRLKQFQNLQPDVLEAVQVHPDERSFELNFSLGQTLYIQCYGPNAQVSLWKKDDLQGSFHAKHIPPPNWEELRSGKRNYATAAQSFPWYRRLMELDATLDLSEWKALFLSGSIYLNKHENEADLTPWKQEGAQTFTRISDAWQAFSSSYLKNWHFHQEKSRLTEQWKKRLLDLEKHLQSARIKHNKLSNAESYRHFGDLIMSNLWQIADGLKDVKLPDYVSGDEVLIPLKPKLTARENAERYYQKAKNQAIELRFAAEKVAHLEAGLPELEKAQEAIAEARNWAELKPFLLAEKEKIAHDERSPYHEFTHLGFSILVGKSAPDNDILTLRIAKKDDLWLHARDVSGSHVVIKHKPGQGFPEPLIEAAAALAAWFSKRKNESLCPVIYTHKKHIRKRKGMLAGQVMVEKERVVLVKPESPDQLFGK